MMAIKYLKEFSPAEALLLIHGANTDIKKLLMLTLTDLILKEVLAFKTEEKIKMRGKKEKVFVYDYVVKGIKYKSHKALPHEKLFLDPFRDNLTDKILLRHLIVASYERAAEGENFLSLVRQIPAFNIYIKRGLSNRLFGGFELSGGGMGVRNALNKEIIILEKELSLLRKDHREAAIRLIKDVGANVFLVQGFQLAVMSKIENEIGCEMNRSEKRNQTGGGCGGGCSTGIGYSADCSSGCGSGCGGGCGGGCGS